MILQFPTIGTQVDLVMKKFWQVIEELPDETSAGSIIAALEVLKFDLIERMPKK